MKDRLIQALEESGLSKTALAEAVGVGASAVSQWLSGQTKSISSEHIFLAARALGVSPEWLATGEGPTRPGGNHVKYLDTRRTVPILNWEMAQPDKGPDQAWYVGGSINTFALRLEGDSMVGPEKSFSPGELIHVDPDDRDVPIGRFVLARIKSTGRIVFRQLQSESGQCYLRALNPRFDPILEPFEVIGRVIGRSETDL